MFSVVKVANKQDFGFNLRSSNDLIVDEMDELDKYNGSKRYISLNDSLKITNDSPITERLLLVFSKSIFSVRSPLLTEVHPTMLERPIYQMSRIGSTAQYIPNNSERLTEGFSRIDWHHRESLTDCPLPRAEYLGGYIIPELIASPGEFIKIDKRYTDTGYSYWLAIKPASRRQVAALSRLNPELCRYLCGRKIHSDNLFRIECYKALNSPTNHDLIDAYKYGNYNIKLEDELIERASTSGFSLDSIESKKFKFGAGGFSSVSLSNVISNGSFVCMRKVKHDHDHPAQRTAEVFSVPEHLRNSLFADTEYYTTIESKNQNGRKFLTGSRPDYRLIEAARTTPDIYGITQIAVSDADHLMTLIDLMFSDHFLLVDKVSKLVLCSELLDLSDDIDFDQIEIDSFTPIGEAYIDNGVGDFFREVAIDFVYYLSLKMVKSVHTMHLSNYGHGDIKLANILIHVNNYKAVSSEVELSILLGDLDSAIYGLDSRAYSKPFTPVYAPSERNCTVRRHDYFSLGCAIGELLEKLIDNRENLIVNDEVGHSDKLENLEYIINSLKNPNNGDKALDDFLDMNEVERGSNGSFENSLDMGIIFQVCNFWNTVSTINVDRIDRQVLSIILEKHQNALGFIDDEVLAQYVDWFKNYNSESNTVTKIEGEVLKGKFKYNYQVNQLIMYEGERRLPGGIIETGTFCYYPEISGIGLQKGTRKSENTIKEGDFQYYSGLEKVDISEGEWIEQKNLVELKGVFREWSCKLGHKISLRAGTTKNLFGPGVHTDGMYTIIEDSGNLKLLHGTMTRNNRIRKIGNI